MDVDPRAAERDPAGEAGRTPDRAADEPPAYSPAVAVFAVVAVALAAGTTALVVREAGGDPTAVGLGLVGPAFVLAALVGVLAWLRRNRPPVRYHRRLLAWQFGGTGALGLGGVTNQLYLLAAGSQVRFSPAAALAWAGGGLVLGALVGVADVRVRCGRDETAAANAHNERLVEALTVLNRVIRHDVRNDLTVLTGYLQLAREEADEAVGEHIDTALARASRIERLAERARLAELAVVGPDRPEGATDLAAVTERVAAGVARTHPDAHVSFRGEAAAGEATVPGHDLLESALHNVVENAVEHSDRAEPVVDVRVRVVDPAALAGDERPRLDRDRPLRGASPTGEVVEVRVADDGPGFPPTERRVLEEGGEAALDESAGMGLWVVHWIVAAAGGIVRVRENEPRGSVVLLRFPRVVADGSGSTDETADT